MLRSGADSPQGVTLPSWAVPRPRGHAKVWVTPREGPPEGSSAWGESGRQAAKGSSGLQNAEKAQLGAGVPEAEDGAGPLVKIPAQFHLLPAVGASCFLISPWGPPWLFSLPIHLCPVPWLHLAQSQAVLMPPAPTAHCVLLTATLGAPSVYLNLQRTS